MIYILHYETKYKVILSTAKDERTGRPGPSAGTLICQPCTAPGLDEEKSLGKGTSDLVLPIDPTFVPSHFSDQDVTQLPSAGSCLFPVTLYYVGAKVAFFSNPCLFLLFLLFLPSQRPGIYLGIWYFYKAGQAVGPVDGTKLQLCTEDAPKSRRVWQEDSAGGRVQCGLWTVEGVGSVICGCQKSTPIPRRSQ